MSCLLFPLYLFRFLNLFYLDDFMKKKGSLTVELSLIMPLVLGVLILIIFLSFYLHDTCAIERIGYTCLLNGIENGYSKEEIINDFDSETETGLLGNWNIKRDIRFSDDSANITVNGTMLWDSRLMFGLINSKVFTYNSNISVNNLCEAEYLWK